MNFFKKKNQIISPLIDSCPNTQLNSLENTISSDKTGSSVEEHRENHKNLDEEYGFLQDPKGCIKIPSLKDDIQYQIKYPNITPEKIYMNHCADFC